MLFKLDTSHESMLAHSAAQLTSPSEAVCVGEQVVFVCQQIGGISRWTVGNLPRGISGFTATALSSLAGMVYSIHDDPGFGFEIYVLPSSSSSSVISELRVTAVRQLNGVTLRCEGGNGSFVSTIQIASIGKSACTFNIQKSSYIAYNFVYILSKNID